MANNLTKSKVLKYALLPGILPRAGTLFFSGFGFFAFFMAQVYRSVRLLPDAHPYLNAHNIGNFGLRDVIAAAANNIKFKKENIDQIAIFTALLLAQILLAMQAISMVLAVLAPKAMAASLLGLGGGGSYFTTANPSQDIAFILLDRVFGVPGVFGSCIGTSVQCLGMSADLAFDSSNPLYKPYATIPWPFHSAMHGLFQFYSIALLAVAVFIFLYFVVVTVAETAQSGTPFGKRFNTVWAPIRLVAAMGLLIPIGHGLNSAQYITLYAAKFGSSFATNGWITFNQTLGNSLPTDTQNMVAKPNAPQLAPTLEFMMLARTCKSIEENHFKNIDGTSSTVEPFIVKGSNIASETSRPMSSTSYQDALAFAKDSGSANIGLSFGIKDASTNKVRPTCGTMVLEQTDISSQPGSEAIRQAYYDLVLELWNDPDIIAYADEYVRVRLDAKSTATTANLPDQTKINDLIAKYQQKVVDILDNAVDEQESAFISGQFKVPADHLQRGWAGAALWYNTIAKTNGTLIGAAWNFPHGAAYPETMTAVKAENTKNNQRVSPLDQYNPATVKGEPVNLSRQGDREAAGVYNEVFLLWQNIKPEKSNSNGIIAVINAIFGTEGLFALRDPDNQQIHPLAQLVGVGKGLIDHTIRNLGIAGIAGAGGIMADGALSQLANNITGFTLSIATITLTMGFILYYIIPFLPFLYFFFATATWVKGVFEGMVGVPLWALAHIRIDGNGLPGDAALNGYYMLFEIFLRPILILFGLLASIAIFSGMASVLHDVFDLVVENVTGANHTETGNPNFVDSARSVIDDLFFTVMYCIIMYIMALSSFKLIDLIPAQIMRWLGTSVSTFSDFTGDPAANLTQYAAVGGAQTFGGITSGLKGGMQGLGDLRRGLGFKGIEM